MTHKLPTTLKFKMRLCPTVFKRFTSQSEAIRSKDGLATALRENYSFISSALKWGETKEGFNYWFIVAYLLDNAEKTIHGVTDITYYIQKFKKDYPKDAQELKEAFKSKGIDINNIT